jgi:putative endonuclease
MGPCFRRDDGEFGVTYWVYILASRPHGTLYIGVTNSLARRLEEHRLGRGSEFVQRYDVKQLVYAEPYETAYDAICREKQLKRWKRDWKIRPDRARKSRLERSE